ncbi:uncharacterized protein LOC126249638 [Schistocerca nitens]|uniref:uncharacterized protein LOC126249638 n=1 Tax=Schistocerca nitens TaxID=7011 RepID=UPI0021189339|nr:uncharacterized protein LOC126249638 [Schistocerca nitens]
MMKISVKVPDSSTLLPVEVAADATLQSLKQAISETSGIPAANQRIIFRGVAIFDDFPLSVYGIKDEAKVAVVKAREGEADCTVLKDAMYRYLRQYYNESDSSKITREFMIYFYKSILNLSLDDLEKLCATFLRDEAKLGS